MTGCVGGEPGPEGAAADARGLAAALRAAWPAATGYGSIQARGLPWDTCHTS